MQNREKWIAIIFTIFILCMPAATVASNLFAGRTEGTYKEIPDAASESDLEKSWFKRFQHDLDQFTKSLLIRKDLIKVNEKFTLAVTGGSYLGSTQVLLGKNKWIFFKTEDDGEPIKDYMGINHFTQNELAEIAVRLTGVRDYFKERGIDFYIMVIPNKEIVYAENMPDTIVRVNEVSRGEQLASYIKEETDLVYVYPKQALCNAKSEHQVYYTTDTHWNQKGAFVGMQELLKEAYGTYADLDSANFLINSTDFAGDLAIIGDIKEQYGIDTEYVFDKFSTDKSQYRDETLLIIGDSFSDFLAIVAKNYYREVYRVTTSEFTMDMVDEYKADVILWESGERRLNTFQDVNLLAQ